LFEQIGIHVAVSEGKRFTIPELDTSVLAVPDVPGPLSQLVPDPATRYNVLLIHADVEDVVPRYYAELDPVPVKISRSDLSVSRWSYIALGHYHVHRRVAENAFYSGSLDYTSLNIWYDRSEERELGLKGKGFLEVDLATGTHLFHVLPPSREFIELRDFTARDMSVAEVNGAIRREVERVKGGIDDKVVRLIIRDIPRQVARELDHRALRDYKRRALSFHLDTRKPEASRRDVAGSADRRPSVAEVVRAQLLSRSIPPDLARERLIDLGMKYLTEAAAYPTSSAVVAEGES
jgi:DNA repair exonuclease SbcCD nuclease subunit